MGISTLRRHSREGEIQEAQPGLVTREDHDRVVRELEDRYAQEIANLKQQLEDAQLAGHELNEYQKKDLLDRRARRETAIVDPADKVGAGRNPSAGEAADPNTLARGGESINTGSSGRTTIGDAESAADKSDADKQAEAEQLEADRQQAEADKAKHAHTTHSKKK